MDAKIYRVIDILNLTTEHLNSRGFENARLNAELIAAHVLNMSRVQLYLNFEKPLAQDELDKLRQLLKRRAQHEPIQYITGETEFYSLKFNVNRSTLIPRPETEILVEAVINNCVQSGNAENPIQILDIGTGSGNIAIALAKHIEHSNITAVDIQPGSLRVAQQNSELHRVQHKIEFLEGDIFNTLFPDKKVFDIIVSNPPYISEQEYIDLTEDVKNYEPEISLKAGNNGVAFYHRIVELARDLLKTGGAVAVEIGANQADSVHNIFSHESIFKTIEIIHDLNKLPRVVLAK